MSLEFKQLPQYDFMPSNNDTIFVISGDTLDSTGITDYKYIGDIYTPSGLTATLKSFPDPLYDLGVFNLKNITNSLLTFDFFDTAPVTTLFREAPNSSVDVDVAFGEEYLTDGTFVQTRNILQSSGTVFYNGSLSWKDQINLDSESFFMSGETSGTKTFMQSYPFNITPFKANPLLKQWLYYYNNTNAINTVFIKTYDINGNQIGIYRHNNPFVANAGMQAVGTGYPQLDQIPDTEYTVVAGLPPIINAGVRSWEIAIGPVTGSTSVSTPYVRYTLMNTDSTQVIDSDCGNTSFPSTKFSAYNLYWLNEFGGFDSWVFNNKSEESQNKQTSQYKKIYGTLNPNGTFNISLKDSNKVNYYTTLQDRITVSTDYLTDLEVIYLRGLFSSPVIFLEDPDGFLYSVNVNDENYTLNKRVNNKMYSLTLSLTYGYNSVRQAL